MNARVDPAGLAAAKEGDRDTALIALCRAALRAIDQDIALEKALNELGESLDAGTPPYPMPAWPAPGGKPSSKQLREMLKERGDRGDIVLSPLAWRTKMKTKIAAVAAWERDYQARRKSLGLDRAERRYQRAMDEARKLVTLVAATEARTLVGSAHKSLVVTNWLVAGYGIGFDVGEQLTLSILADVRRLGGIEAQDVDRLEEAAA